MTQKLKSLNHIPEFATDAGIAGVINFINTGNFPPGLNNRQQQRYTQKFNGFVVTHGVLQYNPNPTINLAVCLNANKQAQIQNIYNNISRGLSATAHRGPHHVELSSSQALGILADD